MEFNKQLLAGYDSDSDEQVDNHNSNAMKGFVYGRNLTGPGPTQGIPTQTSKLLLPFADRPNQFELSDGKDQAQINVVNAFLDETSGQNNGKVPNIDSVADLSERLEFSAMLEGHLDDSLGDASQLCQTSTWPETQSRLQQGSLTANGNDTGVLDAFFSASKGKKILESSKSVSPKSKKSSRRCDNEDEFVGSPKVKKARHHLSGGVSEAEDALAEAGNGDDQKQAPQNILANVPQKPSWSFEDVQQATQEQAGEDDRQYGFGFDDFDKEFERDLPHNATGEEPHQSATDEVTSAFMPSVLGLWGQHSPVPEQNPHGLRQNLDRCIPTTYVDVDQSGNYDPDEEARKIKKPKPRKGKKKVEKKSKILKLILNLKMHRGNFHNALEEYLQSGSIDNWPDGWSDVDSEDERKKQAREEFCRPPDREEYEPQVPILDPSDATGLGDLTGHPVARGCVKCRFYDEDCTMIEDGRYPCKQCVADREEDEGADPCVPLNPPETTGKCYRCQDILGECSFEDPEGDEQEICDLCEEEDRTDCARGPPEGWQPERIDLDKIMYGPYRKYAHCTNCRLNKKSCSLARKAQRGPCKQCVKDRIGCTFYDIPKSVIAKKNKKATKSAPVARNQQNNGESSNLPVLNWFTPEELAGMDEDEPMTRRRELTPEYEMEDVDGRRGVVTKVWTSFSHPMKFSMDEGDTTQCNFCEVPIFGMIGHFEKHAHVLKWHNGLGFSELAGGHGADSFDPTHMCHKCTFSRLQILICEGHHICASANTNPWSGFEGAASDLITAESRSSALHKQLQEWCSLCFSLAAYKCCLPQPSISIAEYEEDAPLLEGCGLNLCDLCERKLREEFHGDSDGMAMEMDKKPKIRVAKGLKSGVVRADVGFLSKQGLLMRVFEAETGGCG